MLSNGATEAVRRCSKCRIIKPPDEFSRNRQRKDGRHIWCKQCRQDHYLASKPPNYQLRQYPKQRNRLYPGLTEKRCAGCGLVKVIVEYLRNSRTPVGRMKRCRDCMGLKRKERKARAGSLEQRRAWEKAYYARHREPELARSKVRNDALRAEVLAAYGRRCVCCGETTAEFLSIDHVNGRGTKHLKELNLTGRAFYLWLKRQSFPQDEYRLLCHNCNIARGHHGQCPHERGH
jgi:hypothetical protein